MEFQMRKNWRELALNHKDSIDIYIPLQIDGNFLSLIALSQDTVLRTKNSIYLCVTFNF